MSWCSVLSFAKKGGFLPCNQTFKSPRSNRFADDCITEMSANKKNDRPGLWFETGPDSAGFVAIALPCCDPRC